MTKPEPTNVRIYFNFRSPYCYLASQTMFKVLDGFNVTLSWHPFGGWSGRSDPERAKKKIPLVRQDVKRWCERLGILDLVGWEGCVGEMIDVDMIGRIRRAYFEQHLPIKGIVRTLSRSSTPAEKANSSGQTGAEAAKTPKQDTSQKFDPSLHPLFHRVQPSDGSGTMYAIGGVRSFKPQN